MPAPSGAALRAKAPPFGHLAPLDSYPTREGWLYLAIVLDLFSRSILGWKLADSLHTDVVTGALRRALDTGIVAPRTPSFTPTAAANNPPPPPAPSSPAMPCAKA